MPTNDDAAYSTGYDVYTDGPLARFGATSPGHYDQTAFGFVCEGTNNYESRVWLSDTFDSCPEGSYMAAFEWAISNSSSTTTQDASLFLFLDNEQVLSVADVSEAANASTDWQSNAGQAWTANSTRSTLTLELHCPANVTMGVSIDNLSSVLFTPPPS